MKDLSKYWLGAVCILGVLGASQSIAAERKLLMSGFKDIIIENDLKVDLTVGKSPRAVVSGAKKDLPKLKLKKQRNSLLVKFDRMRGGNLLQPSKEPISLALSNYALENVTIRGNGIFNSNLLKNYDTARILVTGNGAVTIEKIIADRLEITIIGGAEVTLASGKVRNAKIQIQGPGLVDTSGVNLKDLQIFHDGMGTTKATAANAVKINNNGRGSITIKGKGKCFIEKAGFASIDCPKYAR